MFSHNLLDNFVVIEAPSIYDMIMGHPWIHKLAAIPSTFHLVHRYPSSQGMREIRGNQLQLWRCEMIPKGIGKTKQKVNQMESDWPATRLRIQELDQSSKNANSAKKDKGVTTREHKSQTFCK